MEQTQNLDYNIKEKLSMKITKFEDLSNEIIYEVFDYLNHLETVYSFYDLNERFQNSLINSNYPLHINISSILASKFQFTITNIINSHCYRIKTLRLSNPFASDMFLFIFRQISNINQLQSLILSQISYDNSLNKIINSLHLFSKLISLTIKTIDKVRNQNDIYLKIFQLSSLKYCRLSIKSSELPVSVPLATNQLSSIEYLSIENCVSITQMNNLLSYIPHIRYLTFENVAVDLHSHYQIFNTYNQLFNINTLTNISLQLYSIGFNQLESLFSDVYYHIKVLRLSPCLKFQSLEYLNANRWEQLIRNHLPSLRIFDYYCEFIFHRYLSSRFEYKAAIQQFRSPFWIERQWFFQSDCDHQQLFGRGYHPKIYRHIMFYSINSSRRKCYILSNQLYETSINLIKHLQIPKIYLIINFHDYLPHVTQLTFLNTFKMPRYDYYFIPNSLNRIIPLKQLTKLTLHCYCPFCGIIELLYLTSNVHTLELDSFDKPNFLSIENNNTFHLLLHANQIKNLTIRKVVILDQVKLLVHLCPQLESLTINFHRNDLNSIIQFILLETKCHIRYLSSLYILKRFKDFLKLIKNLIDSEKLLDDYEIKIINGRVYLCW
ncbi:unnamed protein product [Adineta ricciae]|uniref:F-box domain-containing protein n=1 Tax=Adineta ricciae TaxID=249248 RepID=A0A814TV34_ADIRI|nr:unnamed protein product [Adineta ricciae]CAF1501062.1 unnamed protein product [Adineta ricciae]